MYHSPEPLKEKHNNYLLYTWDSYSRGLVVILPQSNLNMMKKHERDVEQEGYYSMFCKSLWREAC